MLDKVQFIITGIFNEYILYWGNFFLNVSRALKHFQTRVLLRTRGWKGFCQESVHEIWYMYTISNKYSVRKPHRE